LLAERVRHGHSIGVRRLAGSAAQRCRLLPRVGPHAQSQPPPHSPWTSLPSSSRPGAPHVHRHDTAPTSSPLRGTGGGTGAPLTKNCVVPVLSACSRIRRSSFRVHFLGSTNMT